VIFLRKGVYLAELIRKVTYLGSNRRWHHTLILMGSKASIEGAKIPCFSKSHERPRNSNGRPARLLCIEQSLSKNDFFFFFFFHRRVIREDIK